MGGSSEQEIEVIASFQIAKRGERSHVMCVREMSFSNPGPLGTELSALPIARGDRFNNGQEVLCLGLKGR
jgi:hypothetical protein